MNKWKLLITRETVLFERYLRVAGYQGMFGSFSKARVKNLLVVNRDGLTSQYIYLPGTEGRRNLVWVEYQRDYLKKLIPYWTKILNNLNNSTKSILSEGIAKSFKEFINYYKLARAIVFYTNDLAKILELKNLVKDIKKIGDWHEKAEVESSRAWDKLAPFFKKICRKHKITIKDLMYYLPNEFLELLKGKKQIENKILKDRQRYYVLYLQNGKIRLYTGRKAQDLKKKQLPQEAEVFKTEEIKGTVASPGYVKGKTRIVNTKNQMEQMKKGEILVSIMTTPRLIPAVKKAIAIVTDEGGITCHAAIISRELKIPCIIGTKIATKVLKDGDLVEVDADKGVVRILKK